MRAIMLMENTACDEALQKEHGLSLYIEAAGQRLLFDSGQTGAFAENAQALGVDLKTVDQVILSHGHYDHGGGLMRFLALNDHAPIWIHPQAFEPHFSGRTKDIGLDPHLLDSGRIRWTSDEQVLGEGLVLRTMNGRHAPYPPSGEDLSVVRNGVQQPDDFCHEQYLSIHEDGKHILISGCSHKGILNVMHWLHPDVLIGGFHLKKVDPDTERPRLYTMADQLRMFDTVYYTAHCTGEAQYRVLREVMGEQLHYFSGGQTLVI